MKCSSKKNRNNILWSFDQTLFRIWHSFNEILWHGKNQLVCFYGNFNSIYCTSRIYIFQINLTSNNSFKYGIISINCVVYHRHMKARFHYRQKFWWTNVGNSLFILKNQWVRFLFQHTHMYMIFAISDYFITPHVQCSRVYHSSKWCNMWFLVESDWSDFYVRMKFECKKTMRVHEKEIHLQPNQWLQN